MPILIVAFSLLGTGATGLGSLACIAAAWFVSFAVAALLELRLQPRIRAWFLRLSEGNAESPGNA
jgi:hypothetical protein